MTLRFKHNLMKLVNELLAIAMAASIILLCSSVVFLSCIQNDGLVEKSLKTYTSETIEMVNERLEEIAEGTGFPAEAYKNIFDENAVDMIFSKVIHNINFSYESEFSNDSEIYNYFKSGITKYCYDNNIDVSEQDIAVNSALAVDAVNEVLGGSSTARIKIAEFIRSNKMVYIVVAPIALIIACFVLIDVINDGKHRRLNYYGMGLTASGLIMLVVPLILFAENYIVDFRFCENEIYSAAFTDITLLALKICMILGIPLVAVGFILLFRNYNYFKTKKKNQREMIQHNKQIRFEYIQELEQKRAQSNSDEEEQLVSKIDFD